MKIAPVPKTIRPIVAFVATSPNMNVPLNCRSPGPNAIQLLIAPKQANMHSPIRYCMARNQNGAPAGRSPLSLAWLSIWMRMASPARKKASPTHSSSQSGPCRLDGPPGIGSSGADREEKRTRDHRDGGGEVFAGRCCWRWLAHILHPWGNLASAMVMMLPHQHCDLIKWIA